MNPFWKDVLDKGAILGVVMAISKVIETHVTSGGSGVTGLTLMSLEVIASLILYISLLVIFARRFRKTVMENMEEPKFFNFSTGWSWTVMTTLLAGVIVGVIGYIDTIGVIGYDRYVDGSIETMKRVFTEAKVPASLTQPISEYFNDIKSAPKPSLAGMVFSTSWVYMLFGIFVGLIIGGALQHSPKLFNDTEDDDE